MAIAQGINKSTVFKIQSALGTAASGSGGQVMRREQSNFNLTKNTFENNEIAQHQQSTGITHGLRSTTGSLNGVLSPNTYSTLIASLLRKAFTATTAVTGASITIAGSGPTYTVTRAAGDFLTGGFKIGDVIRLTVGSFNAANLNKNLLITALTATVATVRPLNGVALVAEGPIASSTVTVIGKKSIAPLTAQTQEYWTVEEWYNDITRSELFTDVVVSSIDIGLPSDGNATFQSSFAGLDRSVGASQILTTPTAATTTPVMAAVNGGLLLVNGTAVGNVTGASIKIDCGAANMGSVVGSDVSPDVQRGRIKVSGQLTAFFQDGVMSALFDDATSTSVILVVANDSSATSDFVTFVMTAIKFSGDSADDGEKGIVKTFPFTAQLNSAGGASLANDQTIISIQDSAAA